MRSEMPLMPGFLESGFKINHFRSGAPLDEDASWKESVASTAVFSWKTEGCRCYCPRLREESNLNKSAVSRRPSLLQELPPAVRWAVCTCTLRSGTAPRDLL